MGLNPTDLELGLTAEPTLGVEPAVEETTATPLSEAAPEVSPAVESAVSDIIAGAVAAGAARAAAAVPASTPSLTPVPESSGIPMSTTSQPLPYSQAPSNAQRPGERLRQARQYQQRDLKEISGALNISERILTAIEADDYKTLPEPAFIRGYLRSYARYLSIDSDILIAQFNEIYTSATGLSSNHSLENSPLQQLAKLQSKTRRSSRWMLWTALAVVAVLLVLAIRPLVKKVMSTAPSAEQTQSAIQTEQNTTSNTQISGNVLPSVTAAPLSNASTAATAATSLPPIAMPSAEDQLVLNLSKSSGVTVQDSTGKTLVSGQQASGEPLTLTGISPFSITLDDAATVSLSLNGESVDLKPYTVQGKAAFRLSR